MRATDLIRSVLCVIDQIDAKQEQPAIPAQASVEIVAPEEEVVTGVDSNRFKQIFDILSTERNQQYDNSPAEVVAGIEAVTTHAGGGVNGPKNPADIKSNSISIS